MANARRRVALITGANRGLGLETSRQLLAQGLIVVLTGRDEAALERAAAGLGQDEERTMTVHMANGRRVGPSIAAVEGADTICWLATLPDNGPTGGFFRDRRAIEW